MRVAAFIVFVIWLAAMWAADRILPPIEKETGVKPEIVNLPKFR